MISAGQVSGAVAAPPRDLPDPAEPVACATQIADIGPQTWSKLRKKSKQVVVVRGYGQRSDQNDVERWERDAAGCWTKLSSWWGLNGARGWHEKPWTGSLYSPSGVFSLTSAGGRKSNPGTAMRYHHAPQYWEKGGYKMHYPVQIFNYVLAINYNRYNKKVPRSTQQPDLTTGSGYWFHQRGLGSTRGCVALKKRQMKIVLRWMQPSAKPSVIMGPRKVLAV